MVSLVLTETVFTENNFNISYNYMYSSVSFYYGLPGRQKFTIDICITAVFQYGYIQCVYGYV